MAGRAPQDAVWGEAREAAREDVRAIFTPEPRTCPVCGVTTDTASRECPECGASYVLVQQKLSKRAKWIIAGIMCVLAVAIGVAAMLASPGIEKTKRDNAARDAAERKASIAEKRRVATFQQRPMTLQVPPGKELVPALEAAVYADALARVRTGELKGRIRRAKCLPTPNTAGRKAQEGDPSVAANTYSCTAVTSVIASGAHAGGLIGHPFLAVVHYRQRRLNWCKANPPPGEQAIGQGANVALSKSCTTP